MLKFCKGIFSSALFVVLLIPFSLTSCAKNKNSNLDYSSPYADFINERTFSMLCVVPNIEPGKIGYIAGTGWLFKKSINADYEYYLATNLHVSASYPYYSTAGKSVSFWLSYCPDYKNSNYYIPYVEQMKDLPDYFYQINSYSILASTPEQRPILANYSSALGYECDLDFNVFDVNFGTSNDISSNDPFRKNGSPLLNRLNGLNQYAQTKANNLLEFADSNYTYKKNMSIHVGGFPARPWAINERRLKWICYQTYIDNWYFAASQNNPLINPEDPIQFAPQDYHIAILGKELAYGVNTTSELTGGSSGSMIIDDDNKVIGINFASAHSEDEYSSLQGFGLFLNCNNNFFGNNYRYEIFNSWLAFKNLP